MERVSSGARARSLQRHGWRIKRWCRDFWGDWEDSCVRAAIYAIDFGVIVFLHQNPSLPPSIFCTCSIQFQRRFQFHKDRQHPPTPTQSIQTDRFAGFWTAGGGPTHARRGDANRRASAHPVRQPQPGRLESIFVSAHQQEPPRKGSQKKTVLISLHIPEKAALKPVETVFPPLLKNKNASGESLWNELFSCHPCVRHISDMSCIITSNKLSNSNVTLRRTASPAPAPWKRFECVFSAF